MPERRFSLPECAGKGLSEQAVALLERDEEDR
jgi:hypothetical protein